MVRETIVDPLLGNQWIDLSLARNAGGTPAPNNSSEPQHKRNDEYAQILAFLGRTLD